MISVEVECFIFKHRKAGNHRHNHETIYTAAEHLGSFSVPE
jgi:hypothetical protein